VPFDPFGDNSRRGYLRNKLGLPDKEALKPVEYVAIQAAMPAAAGFLKRQRTIGVDAWRSVHRLLFKDIFP